MPVTATHTIRVAAGLRTGFDHQQHRPESPTTAVCGAAIKEQRYDRPDLARCLDCVEAKGIDVPAPPELEQRALFGDR